MSESSANCPSCGAKPSELHKLGCEVERCPRCGRQLYLCIHYLLGAVKPPPPNEERMPWTGEWPGVSECREFGWFAKRNQSGPGYVPCSANDPEAVPDLNRLRKEAAWDALQKRFVKKSNQAGSDKKQQ